MTEPTDQPYQHPENYAAIGYPTVRTLNRAQKLSIAELLQYVLPYRPPSGSVLMLDSEGSPLSFFDPTGLGARIPCHEDGSLNEAGLDVPRLARDLYIYNDRTLLLLGLVDLTGPDLAVKKSAQQNSLVLNALHTWVGATVWASGALNTGPDDSIETVFGHLPWESEFRRHPAADKFLADQAAIHRDLLGAKIAADFAVDPRDQNPNQN